MDLEVLTARGGAHAYVLVRLVAERGGDVERSPVNLAVVVDRSSSMRGPRLAQAVRAVRELAARLEARDRLSIVSFDANARLVFGPEQVDDAARPRIEAALAGLDSGAGTNLAAGIKKGADLLRASYVRGAISRLILLTDGRPSIGVTDGARLCAQVESERDTGGVTTTTMGIGEGFDDELLAEMARCGRGGFYYLATPADIPAAFGRELAGVFAIAARGARLKLVPGDAVLAVDLLHRLPSRPVDDGLVVEVGEVACGAPRQALFRLTLGDHPGSTHLATLTSTYESSDGRPGDARIVGIELSDDATAARIVTLERLRLEVARAVDVAWARRASGDAMNALSTLREIETALAGARDRDEAEAAELELLLADVAAAEVAVTEGAVERERIRRGMREKSQITLLGHSLVAKIPRDD